MLVLGEREFFFGVIGKFLFSNFSKRRVTKEIQMDHLLKRPSITVNEYNKFINDIEARYHVRKTYVCPSCFRVLPKIKSCICKT